MKKIIVLILVLILLSGCNRKNISNEIINEEENLEISNEAEEEIYTDQNNTNIGLYLYQNSQYELVTEYKTNLINTKDIAIFDIYPSNEKSIPKYNYINNLYNEWTSLENFNLLKIGFNINYILSSGETISYNIFDPTTATHYDIGHIYAYIYDDYKHRFDSWYSHIEQDEFDEGNSLFTSIKLYSSNIDEISSPINFTVFTYDSDDDFDKDGNYRGNSKYSIKICDIDKTC